MIRIKRGWGKKGMGWPVAFLLVVLLIPLVLHDPPEQQCVLLSFDTELPAVSPQVFGELLFILEQHNVIATFFVTGEFADAHPELLQQAVAAGNEVACHSYDHPHLTQLNRTAQSSQLVRCRQSIERAVGTVPVGFRAPWRSLDSSTMDLLADSGFMYDASSFEGFEPFFPPPRVREIATSSFGPLPLDDYVDLVSLHMAPDAYFWMLANAHDAEYLSFSFHPALIMEHARAFEDLLTTLQSRGVRFCTHGMFEKETADVA